VEAGAGAEAEEAAEVVAAEAVVELPEAAAAVVHEAVPDPAAEDARARVEPHHLAGPAAETGRVAEIG
jgi:hypothetical protein